MKKTIFYLSFIFLSAFQCETTDDEVCCLHPTQITFKTGTNFGFCAGYCFRELTIHQDLVTTFKKESRYPGPEEYPDVEIESSISQAKYDKLVQALNQSGFFSLKDTLSDCLDCADQGAEWVEIEQAGEVKKVVFDAGDNIKEIELLLNELRALRETYE